MSSQEATPPPPASNCEVCGQQFTNIEELHKHKTEVHKGENNQPKQQ